MNITVSKASKVELDHKGTASSWAACRNSTSVTFSKRRKDGSSMYLHACSRLDTTGEHAVELQAATAQTPPPSVAAEPARACTCMQTKLKADGGSIQLGCIP